MEGVNKAHHIGIVESVNKRPDEGVQDIVIQRGLEVTNFTVPLSCDCRPGELGRFTAYAIETPEGLKEVMEIDDNTGEIVEPETPFT